MEIDPPKKGTIGTTGPWYTNKTLPLFTAGPAFQILTVRREQAIKIESIMRKLNMLVAFASVLTFVSSSTAAQSSIDGHWEGVMVRQGSELIVSFDFSDEAAGIRGSFNSLTLHALRIPLRNVTHNAPNGHFFLVGDFTTIILTANCRPLRLPGNSVKVLIETGSSEKAMP